MPDRNTPEWLLMRAQERTTRPQPRTPKPPQRWPPSEFHDPHHTAQARVPRKPAPMPLTPPAQPRTALSAKKMKITVVLDAAELLAVPTPEGKPRITLRIQLPDRVVTADIAAKSLRKAQAAIREHGAENVACILQGSLVGDAIIEAGLSAQVKATKAPPEKEPTDATP